MSDVPKIMSSVLNFAEIMQFMHKTTSCRLSDHWLMTQVNISFTRSLASYNSVHRFIAYSLDYTQNDRKQAENVLETRAYIKGRSSLGIKTVDIHPEVCDIYWEGQMSHRTVCRWVAKEALAIRCVFSLVDMITNTKFSNCTLVFIIGAVRQ